MLKKALESLQQQTFTNWIAEVINDDPEDIDVDKLIHSINDPRIYLSEPKVKRGGTANFNYAFRKVPEPMACILEDDNWYEPDFLKIAVNELSKDTSVQLVVTNERIWDESNDGQWTFRGTSIWDKTEGKELFYFHDEDKCGQAKICNSSMVWKTDRSFQWLTPSVIPIDVTEHFRERVVPHPILLINEPLVNYSNTLKTYRSENSTLWGIYQTLLISSIFNCINTSDANDLAKKLWSRARSKDRLFRTTLLNTALASESSRVLLYKASSKELLRYLITAIRRPKQIWACLTAKRKHKEEWQFLVNAYLNNDQQSANSLKSDRQ